MGVSEGKNILEGTARKKTLKSVLDGSENVLLSYSIYGVYKCIFDLTRLFRYRCIAFRPVYVREG